MSALGFVLQKEAELETLTLDVTSALMATDSTLARVLTKAKFWEQHRSTVLNERQRLLLNKLFDGFEGNLNSSKWAKIAKCSTDTALRDIQDLIDKMILRKAAAGGRSTSYELVEQE